MTSARKRPSLAVLLAGAALVAALAALVLSLTGVATGLPGKNRIDRNDLGKRVVRPINVRKNAINGFHVREGTLGRVPNADRVDGHDAACPSGYIAVAGSCYEALPRTDADWQAAAEDCADENASLPTVGQLRLARDELGNLSLLVFEWTDSRWEDDADGELANGINSAGQVGSFDTSDLMPYRCVVPLLR